MSQLGSTDSISIMRLPYRSGLQPNDPKNHDALHELKDEVEKILNIRKKTL